MWHRIPTEFDEVEATIDCFGRDKYLEYKKDMGGVGSFNFDNRTLYVGRVTVSDDMEDIVRRHFSEWGPIESGKDCAVDAIGKSLTKLIPLHLQSRF